MDDKRYYWIKLKETFITSDAVDYLMSQKNGANYVVLYQMLCLKTVNTQGTLARNIGEIIIPYDAEKIQRDCKFFDIDTIRVAIELYKKLGLVYEQTNGILKIADFERIVGSETEWAEKKRKYREQIAEDKARTLSETKSDKILDIRDKNKNIVVQDTTLPHSTPKKQSNLDPTIAKQIIDYLNSKTGKNFRATTKATKEFINARLNEKRTLSDFQFVIDNRVKEWKGSKMEEYLRPSTLFAPTNFENYLNSKDVAPQKAETKTTYRELD